MEELARGFSNESDYSSPAAPDAQGREVRTAGQLRGLSVGRENNFYLQGSSYKEFLTALVPPL